MVFSRKLNANYAEWANSAKWFYHSPSSPFRDIRVEKTTSLGDLSLAGITVFM
jgi:hypothetical protein